jgi:hypothetical protein
VPYIADLWRQLSQQLPTASGRFVPAVEHLQTFETISGFAALGENGRCLTTVAAWVFHQDSSVARFVQFRLRLRSAKMCLDNAGCKLLASVVKPWFEQPLTQCRKKTVHTNFTRHNKFRAIHGYPV